MSVIFGVNPVIEALRGERRTVQRIAIATGARISRFDELMQAARSAGVPVARQPSAALDRTAGTRNHQGVVAVVGAAKYAELDDVIARMAERKLVVLLDGVEDPHNLGAILRSVHAAGASGVVRQSRHAAPLDGAAAKASAGAVHHVRVADVVNIARALEDLKEQGVWTVGLDADADLQYDEVDLTLPTAIVVGAEGSGLRRLVRERCDRLASIPMRGQLGSLNVSVAAAILLFEAVRQRNRGRSRT